MYQLFFLPPEFERCRRYNADKPLWEFAHVSSVKQLEVCLLSNMSIYDSDYYCENIDLSLFDLLLDAVTDVEYCYVLDMETKKITKAFT